MLNSAEREISKFNKYNLIIHAIRPGLSVTVPDFDTLSWHPGKHEKIKLTGFLRPIEGEGFVINSCLDGKCCIYCRLPIINGIPVVIDRH